MILALLPVVTLHASAAPTTHTVTFMSNGSIFTTQPVNDGDTATQPAPTYSGNTFGGWYIDSTFLVAYTFGTPVTSDLTLYAKWTPTTYNVTFDTNGGSFITGQVVKFNGKVNIPAITTRSNYNFTGWYSDAGLTTQFDFSTILTKDITLYAGWSEINCAVSFNSNGGTAVDTQTIVNGSTAAVPQVPVKEGFTFGGWFSEAGLTNQYNFSAPITGDMTLYAKWIQITYTLTFVSNGVDIGTVDTVNYGAPFTKPLQDPTNTGFKFAGWYSDAGLTIPFDFNAIPKADSTAYAAWTPITYSVTFNSDGGSAVSGQTVKYNNKANMPAVNPTRTNYTFAGWYTDQACTSAYDFSTILTGNLTLYAGWTEISCTVTFDSNGGDTVNAKAVPNGQAVDKPADPSRDGYTFAGWYSDPSLLNAYSFNAAVTGDITLYAMWTPITYTVAFNSNGGSAVSDNTVGYKGTATAPKAPTKTGFDFAGWYSDAQLTALYDFNSIVSGNMTLYAAWTPITYAVTFDSNDGSLVTNQTVNFGGKANKPDKEPTKDNSTFVGWYSDENLATPYDFSTVLTGDITLYAKWIETTCTVTFESNNGGSTVSSIPVTNGQTVSMPADPIWDGFKFAGWYMDTGLTNLYDFSTPVTGDITLYAAWTPIIYTVTFESNGSTVSSEPVAYGDAALVPDDPTNTGMTLVGWYTDAGLTTAYDFSTGVFGDMTLYAKWTPTVYIVTFNSNGDGSVTTQKVDFGGKANSPTTDPTRDNYTFMGWYSDSALTIPYNFSTVLTGDITLYAKWFEINCMVTFDSNGGSSVDSQTVKNGETITQPSNPTYQGYSFGGWYSNTGLTAAYSFAAPVTGDITLYAQWFTVGVGGAATTKAPVLSDGSATRTDSKDASITFTSDSSGVFYYQIVTAGATAPSIDTSGAGQSMVSGKNTLTISTLSSFDACNIYIVGKAASTVSAATLMVTIPKYDTLSGKFTDVAGNWAFKYAQILYDKGIRVGYPDSTMRLDQSITRAEMAAVLVRALNIPLATSISLTFNDKNSIPDWAKYDIQTCVNKGILKGDSNNNINASAVITRNEAAVMLMRAFSLSASTTALTFTDSLPGWAKDAVSALVSAGALSGYPDNTFKGSQSISNGELDKVICILLKLA